MRAAKSVAPFIFVLLAITLPSLIHLTAASSTNYLINLDGGVASFSVSIQMRQNFTLTRPDFAFPVFHMLAQGTNSSEPSSTVQNAIRTKVAGAEVTNFVVDAHVSNWSNVTQLQWFNESISFNVSNITTSGGDATVVNLAWKSFSVTSNIQLRGYEINNIADAYVLGIARDLSHSTSGSGQSLTFLVNYRSVTPSRFADPSIAPNFFNFTRLESPLSSWQHGYTPLTKTDVYSQSDANLGLVFSRTIVQEQIPVTESFGMLYDVVAQISVPAGSKVQGDTVSSYHGTSELMMGVLIVAVTGMVSGAFLYERRLTSSMGKGYVSKKKQRR